MFDSALSDVTLAQFSLLSTFLCSLTGWTGLYFHLAPQCDAENIFWWICFFITLVTVSLHTFFISWAIRSIVKTRLAEQRLDGIKEGGNVMKTDKVGFEMPAHDKVDRASVEQTKSEFHANVLNDCDVEVEHVVVI